MRQLFGPNLGVFQGWGGANPQNQTFELLNIEQLKLNNVRSYL